MTKFPKITGENNNIKMLSCGFLLSYKIEYFKEVNLSPV